jgi:hypothetical protein
LISLITYKKTLTFCLLLMTLIVASSNSFAQPISQGRMSWFCMHWNPICPGMADSLMPGAIAGLQTEWLKQFQATMRKGHPAEILKLVEQIRPENASLAQALAELVHVHRFDSLVSLTDQALEESSNG